MAIDNFKNVLTDAGRQALLHALSELCRTVGAAESSVLRPEGDAELAFFVSTNPALVAPSMPKVPIAGSFAGIVFRTGQMLAVADAVRQPGHFGAIDAAVGRATREYAALPIADGPELLGVLTLMNRTTTDGQASRPFTVDELRKAQQVAMELAEPLAVLDTLGASRRDSVREALGDDFIRDLLALDGTGRQVVRCLAAALPRDLGTERP